MKDGIAQEQEQDVDVVKAAALRTRRAHRTESERRRRDRLRATRAPVRKRAVRAVRPPIRDPLLDRLAAADLDSDELLLLADKVIEAMRLESIRLKSYRDRGRPKGKAA